MRLRKSLIPMFLSVCTCLVLSGCFQGYGQDVSSQAEIEAILSSTPGNLSQPQQQNTPLVQPTSQPTRVPTLPQATATNTVLIQGGMIIHIVGDGDTLFGIAQQYGVTVEMLSALNGITDPNSLFVEQALIIPPTPMPQPPTEESTQTSNLPTASPTDLPTLTFTPTFTVTPSLTPSSTAIPPTEIPTLTPSATAIPPTAIPTLTPSATEVILLSQTPSSTAHDDQLRATVHVIHTGETLFQISQQYHVPLEALTQANQIEDPSQVSIGQELVIPMIAISETFIGETPSITPSETATETPPDISEETPSDTIHVVSVGETLYQISLEYGISLESLADANDITDSNQVMVGQELYIPIATPMSVLDASDTTPQNAISSTVPQRIALNYPTQINSIPTSQFVVISPEVEANILQIYQQGIQLGRNPRAFSKLGDSTIENPHFLARFDHWEGFGYTLGDYGYLQGVIDYYAGSFIRQGAAVRRGMHSWTVFDPQWADKSLCLANEPALTCEFRIQNPSILLIRLGANDVGVPRAFENNLRDVIEFSIENGVIPVLGTKADRNDGASNANNLIIHRLAIEYELPLWDFDRLADTLPRRGLTTDGVHMTVNFSHDYTDPNTFRTGHGVHNLSALVMLDSLWEILTSGNS